MKKYLLFTWERYEESGGMNDLTAQSDNLGAIMNFPLPERHEYFHIVNTENGTLVSTNAMYFHNIEHSKTI